MELIIGVDSIGFKALAGPIVAAAVAYKNVVPCPYLERYSFEHAEPLPLQDARKINNLLLPRFEKLIQNTCLRYETLICSPSRIKNIGRAKARIETQKSVVLRLLDRLSFESKDSAEEVTYSVIGSIPLQEKFNYTMRPDAAKNEWHVSAASVMAKTRHTRQMLKLHWKYPAYKWDKNLGFTTKKHREAIARYGKSEYHR